MTTVAFADMKREDRANLQKALNQLTKAQPALVPDGAIGPKTLEVLKRFQLKSNIPRTGVYDDLTQSILSVLIAAKYVQAADFKKTAQDLGAEVAAVRAVCEVEAKASGFLPDGRVLILHERHKFYEYLVKNRGKAFANEIFRKFPDICNPDTGGYKGNEAEWPRHERAIAIDRNAALMSSSYGLFQIMGFNFKRAGYPTVEAYYESVHISERKHMEAFKSFVQSSTELLSAIRSKNWAVFAKNYNGAGYAMYQYDIKMATAYDRNKPWNLM